MLLSISSFLTSEPVDFSTSSLCSRSSPDLRISLDLRSAGVTWHKKSELSASSNGSSRTFSDQKIRALIKWLIPAISAPSGTREELHLHRITPVMIPWAYRFPIHSSLCSTMTTCLSTALPSRQVRALRSDHSHCILDCPPLFLCSVADGIAHATGVEVRVCVRRNGTLFCVLQGCLKSVKAVAMSVINILASSTGNFNVTLRSLDTLDILTTGSALLAQRASAE